MKKIDYVIYFFASLVAKIPEMNGTLRNENSEFTNY